MLLANEPAEPAAIQLDPIALLAHASGPVKATVALLILGSALVWIIAVLKSLQLGRLRSAERRFDAEAARAASAEDLFRIAAAHRDAAGGRVVSWLAVRGAPGSADRLRAIAERAIVNERQRASTFMPILGTVAAVAPFVGLFGTVYGIIDAFIRIGAAKSASLPVVAPAIGEALLATAIGLAAAIPAVVFYNLIDKRLGDFESELEAAAEEWVHLVAETRAHTSYRAPDTQFDPRVQGRRA
jgi:biopolymer transport protein TolQ